MLLTPEQARRTYDLAVREHFALLAVNADSPAAVVDVLEAARQADAPVIIETSLWQLTGHSYGAEDAQLGMSRYLAQLALLCESGPYADVPVIYHTDHIKGAVTLPLLKAAIAGLPMVIAGHELSLRPSSISLDSSELSQDENIHHIQELCAHADTLGAPLTLEMEAGVDDGLTPLNDTEALLKPVEAAHPGYLALWAPGVGTRHGYSAEGFPTFSHEHVAEQHRLASDICGRPIGLALHGSSGLANEQLQAAVAAGVAKVNWSTDSLATRSAAATAYYEQNAATLERGAAGFKNAAMDNGVQTAIAQIYIPVVTERMQTLGSAGQGAAVREALAGAAV